MARRELGPAALRVAQAVLAALPDGGEVTVGVSGGADPFALALGTLWAAPRKGVRAGAIVVDHQLQEGSGDIAAGVAEVLGERGLPTRVVAVDVPDSPDGVEAAARDARLAALSAPGHPVLLGHTLDDQAESVLLGLLRGSGTRSLAGMAPVRGSFIRPLLDLRRADTVDACRDWGVEPWHDPMNDDPRFARVQARQALATLNESFGRDLSASLARTASLARADAEYLDAVAAAASAGDTLDARALAELHPAIRRRAIHQWLTRRTPTVSQAHVLAVAALVDDWRGQGAVAVPGGAVERVDGWLAFRGGRG